MERMNKEERTRRRENEKALNAYTATEAHKLPGSLVFWWTDSGAAFGYDEDTAESGSKWNSKRPERKGSIPWDMMSPDNFEKITKAVLARIK
jgi:hypothetical protein